MDPLEIDIDKGLVRMATAFHGGGGCHRDVISENIEDLRHPVYADSDPTTSVVKTRSRPGEDITCPSELAFQLHNRFEETLG